MCIGQPQKLNREAETLIFRIVNELVGNVQKHAKATEATVQLVYHDTFLNLIVEDNGIGFHTHQGEGVGLRNLRTKAEYLNAELSIDTNERGTSVILTIPFLSLQPL